MSANPEPDDFGDLSWKVRGNWQRIVSLAVAFTYIAIIVWSAWSTFPHSISRVVSAVIYLTFVLACIWFADDMGEYFNIPYLKPSSGTAVRVGGWFLLFLPVLILLLIRWIEYGL
jgi:hypothetical protein